MDTLSAFPELRLIHAPGEQANSFATAVAAIDPEQPVDWLAERAAEEGFHLVLASMNAHVVGFMAAQVDGALIEIIHAVVSPVVAAQHPEVLSALVEGTLDCDARPWADVRISKDSPALVHLLRTGWQPVAADRPQRPAHMLTLTGAGVE